MKDIQGIANIKVPQTQMSIVNLGSGRNISQDIDGFTNYADVKIASL